MGKIDFEGLNRLLLPVLPDLLRKWLPDGRLRGIEWIARNPNRKDRHSGSFSINTVTGRWADFATGDSGGDVVSLYAYLTRKSQADAALTLWDTLGGIHAQ